MIFQKILPELAGDLKIGELSLDENSQITLNFDDSLDVTFEIDEENDELLIFLPKYEWTLEKFASPEFLRGNFNSFCFGARTNGFAFTYNVALKAATLWRRYRNDFSGKDEIIAIIIKLLEASKEVDNATDDLPQADVETEMENEFFASNLLFNLGSRV